LKLNLLAQQLDNKTPQRYNAIEDRRTIAFSLNQCNGFSETDAFHKSSTLLKVKDQRAVALVLNHLVAMGSSEKGTTFRYKVMGNLHTTCHGSCGMS